MTEDLHEFYCLQIFNLFKKLSVNYWLKFTEIGVSYTESNRNILICHQKQISLLSLITLKY